MYVDQSRPKQGDDNLALLKNDIDSGRTGDKVANPDPGLSPLGTDDEAGGYAPTPEQISYARRQEVDIGAHIQDKETHSPRSKRPWSAIIMVCVIAAFALMILARL